MKTAGRGLPEIARVFIKTAAQRRLLNEIYIFCGRVEGPGQATETIPRLGYIFTVAYTRSVDFSVK